MSSCSTPRIGTFLAAASINQYCAVKASGTDGKSVDVGTAASDKLIGICQNAASTSIPAEVALPGGGAKAKLGGTVAFGDKLTATTAGKLITTVVDHDRFLAIAMKDGVDGDVIPVEVVIGSVSA